jgi:hypothetical protein
MIELQGVLWRSIPEACQILSGSHMAGVFSPVVSVIRRQSRHSAHPTRATAFGFSGGGSVWKIR